MKDGRVRRGQVGEYGGSLIIQQNVKISHISSSLSPSFPPPNKKVEPCDLVHYGILPEFVGRFPVVVSTSGLSLEQLVRVLTEPKNALIKQYRYLFALHHVDFHVSNEALEEIAALALEKNTGARGLRSILERVRTAEGEREGRGKGRRDGGRVTTQSCLEDSISHLSLSPYFLLPSVRC